MKEDNAQIIEVWKKYDPTTGLMLSLITFAGLLLILFIALGAEATPVPVTGDWDISDNTVVEDQDVTVSGNVIVRNGGSLSMKNVTLTMKCAHDGEFGVIVENGGSLLLKDIDMARSTQDDMTVIQADSATGNKRYGFRAEAGSTLVMIGASIRNCGWEDVGDNRGPTILCDNSLIFESIFSSNYIGIVYNGSLGGFLSRCNISGNALGGAYLINTTNGTIEKCNISGSNGHGIHLFHSRCNCVRSNRISGFFHNQVFWPSYNGSAVLLDNSHHNLIDRNHVESPRSRGFWLRRAHSNEISNNYLEGNTYTNTMVSFGIGLLNSSGNSIHHNELHHHFMSIYLNYFSNFNRVENNHVNFTIRGLSLGDPIYGWWDAYKGQCDHNYFGNNSVNNTEFHGLVMVEGSSFNHIYNTTFTNAQQRSHGGTKYGFLLDLTYNNTIEASHFYNNSLFSVGIGLQRCSGCIVKNNVMGSDGFNQEAIYVNVGSTNNTVENNTIFDREWSLTIQDDSDWNVIGNNTVYNCSYGIYIIKNCEHNLLLRNRIYNSTESGIKLMDFPGSDELVLSNILRENVIHNCTTGIINTEDGWATVLIDNVIFDCDVGIRLEGSGDHRILSGEIFRCRVGISLDSVANSQIGSVIRDIYETTVDVTGCETLSIVNSTFYNNTVGLACEDGIDLISNSSFHNNTDGLTMVSDRREIVRCGFRDNHRGIYSIDHAISYINDSQFEGNNVSVSLGDSSHFEMVRCAFIDNLQYGLYCDHASSAILIDCSFSSSSDWGIFCTRNGRVDMVVGRSVTIENEKMFIAGNIDILSGGRLHINDSMMKMVSSGALTSVINIHERGYLGMMSSTVERGSTGPYRFNAFLASRLDIVDCGIIGCGIPTRAVPQEGSGLTLEGSFATIRNTEITDSPCGIFSRGSSLELDSVSIGNCEYWICATGGYLNVSNSTFASKLGVEEQAVFTAGEVLLDGCTLPRGGHLIEGKNYANIIIRDTLISSSCMSADWTSRFSVEYGISFRFDDPLGAPVSGLQFRIMENGSQEYHEFAADRNGTFGPLHLVSFFVHGYAVNDSSNPHSIIVLVESPSGYRTHTFRVDRMEELSFRVDFYPLFDVPQDVSMTEGGFILSALNLSEVFLDASNLEFSHVQCDHFTLIIHPNGSVDILTNDPDWFGIESLTFIGTNRFGLSSYVTLNVTVLPLDDPPVISPLVNITIDEGEVVRLDLRDIITDVDTPFTILNISVEGMYYWIDGTELYLLHHNVPGPVLIRIVVSDNETSVNGSFFVFHEYRKIPVFLAIPDLEVMVNQPHRFDLAAYIDISEQDCRNLTVTETSPYGEFEGFEIVLLYPYGVRGERITVYFRIGENIFMRTLNVTVSGGPAPVFQALPELIVIAGIEYNIDLDDHFIISARDLPSLSIAVQGSHASVRGHVLTLLYPEGIGNDRIVVIFYLYGREYVRTLNVSITTPNHSPVLGDMYFERSGNEITFVIHVTDRNRKNVTVHLVLDGNLSVMDVNPGRPGVYSITLALSPGRYTYFYTVDDGAGANNSMVNTSQQWLNLSAAAEKGAWQSFSSGDSPAAVYILAAALLFLILMLLLFWMKRRRDSDEEVSGDEEEDGGEREGTRADEDKVTDGDAGSDGDDTEKRKKWLAEGIELSGKGDYFGALSALDRVISARPENSSAWYLKGVVYTRMGDCNMAEGCMENAVRFTDDPGRFFKQTIMAVIECSYREEDRKNRILQLLKKGIFFSAKKDYVQSLKAFDRVISAEPENYDAWYLKAITYGRMGDRAMAKRCLTEASRISEISTPSVPPGMRGPEEKVSREGPVDREKSRERLVKGIKEALRGELDKAVHYLDEAAVLDPLDPNPWYQKGLIHQGRGEHEKADTCWERVIELHGGPDTFMAGADVHSDPGTAAPPIPEPLPPGYEAQYASSPRDLFDGLAPPGDFLSADMDPPCSAPSVFSPPPVPVAGDEQVAGVAVAGRSVHPDLCLEDVGNGSPEARGIPDEPGMIQIDGGDAPNVNGVSIVQDRAESAPWAGLSAPEPPGITPTGTGDVGAFDGSDLAVDGDRMDSAPPEGLSTPGSQVDAAPNVEMAESGMVEKVIPGWKENEGTDTGKPGDKVLTDDELGGHPDREGEPEEEGANGTDRAAATGNGLDEDLEDLLSQLEE